MPKPKNDIYIRSLVGLVFVAVVVGAAMLGFGTLFWLMLFISSVCIYEFLAMQKALNITALSFAWMANGLILLSGGAWFREYQFAFLPLLIGLFIMYVSVELFRQRLEVLNAIRYPLVSIIYISLPFACFLLFSKGDGLDYNWRKPLLPLILVWSSDTFAYVAGRLFGKRPLLPALSPKKTIEGWIGGTILAAAAGGVLAYFWPFVGLYNGILLGILVSIFGTMGDLFESALKRNAGVKDSGKIMPGHGGLLDRFDAFLFASIIVYGWYALLNTPL